MTASPATNYNTSWSGSCGGTSSGNSFTTNAVNANCTVVASFRHRPGCSQWLVRQLERWDVQYHACHQPLFRRRRHSTRRNEYEHLSRGAAMARTAVRVRAVAPAKTTTPPPTGGNDPGTGSWWPASNRLIADQTGTSSSKISYIPGCLNGESASSGSNGCALNSTYDGFSFGSGKVLGVRYVSKSPVSTATKYFKVNSAYGGAVSSSLKAWLSTNPASTFESTTTGCRSIYTAGNLYVITGSSYCQIQPNTQYYLFVNDETGTETRFILDETSADFQ